MSDEETYPGNPSMNMERLQFVWWGFSTWRWPWYRDMKGRYANFYKWCAGIGPIEIRCWNEQDKWKS